MTDDDPWKEADAADDADYDGDDDAAMLVMIAMTWLQL